MEVYGLITWTRVSQRTSRLSPLAVAREVLGWEIYLAMKASAVVRGSDSRYRIKLSIILSRLYGIEDGDMKDSDRLVRKREQFIGNALAYILVNRRIWERNSIEWNING